MDRVVLLALLGIPVLVIMHVALFASPLPSTSMLVDEDRDRPVLQGTWRMPEPPGSMRLVIKHLPEQGS
jgi:hypothetical protein